MKKRIDAVAKECMLDRFLDALNPENGLKTAWADFPNSVTPNMIAINFPRELTQQEQEYAKLCLYNHGFYLVKRAGLA